MTSKDSNLKRLIYWSSRSSMYSIQEDGQEHSTSTTLNWLMKSHLVRLKNNQSRLHRSASMNLLRKTITIINKLEMLLGKKLKKIMYLKNLNIVKHVATHLKRPNDEPRSQPCKLASGTPQWRLSEWKTKWPWRPNWGTGKRVRGRRLW